MARGTTAKNNVINKLSIAFGSEYVGEDEKGRVYVWADDGGEKVQIALALTCPKVQLETSHAPKVAEHSDWDWDGEPAASFVQEPAKAEVTEEEKARIEELMKRLNL